MHSRERRPVRRRAMGKPLRMFSTDVCRRQGNSHPCQCLWSRLSWTESGRGPCAVPWGLGWLITRDGILSESSKVSCLRDRTLTGGGKGQRRSRDYQKRSTFSHQQRRKARANCICVPCIALGVHRPCDQSGSLCSVQGLLVGSVLPSARLQCSGQFYQQF